MPDSVYCIDWSGPLAKAQEHLQSKRPVCVSGVESSAPGKFLERLKHDWQVHNPTGKALLVDLGETDKRYESDLLKNIAFTLDIQQWTPPPFRQTCNIEVGQYAEVGGNLVANITLPQDSSANPQPSTDELLYYAQTILDKLAQHLDTKPYALYIANCSSFAAEPISRTMWDNCFQPLMAKGLELVFGCCTDSATHCPHMQTKGQCKTIRLPETFKDEARDEAKDDCINILVSKFPESTADMRGRVEGILLAAAYQPIEVHNDLGTAIRTLEAEI